MQTLHFDVRFVCYQYNMGGGDLANGYKRCSKKFDTATEALEFADKVREFAKQKPQDVTDANSEFAENYVYAGFVYRCDGVFRVYINEELM